MMPKGWIILLKLVVTLLVSDQASAQDVVVSADPVELGSSATLTCTLQGGGSGTLEYQWTIGGVVRQPRSPQSTFFIREAGVNDSRSDYGCTVYDGDTTLPEVMGTLYVHIPNFTLIFRESTPNPAKLNYIGQNATYLCHTLFPASLSDLTGDLVITGPDNTPVEEGSGRVRTLETVINSNAYERMLYFSPLSAADEGNYRCMGTISPRLPHPFVSNGMGDTVLQIIIFSPDLSVNVSPMATRLLDIPPYNLTTLTCTSTVTVRGAPVPIAIGIMWLLAIGANSSSASVPAETFTDIGSGNSTLTLSTTQPGNYTYSCLVVLNISLVTDRLNRTKSATVEVIGPAVPLPPGNPTTPPETLSHSQATVQWHVAMLSYDPEEYRVLYGTSEANLSLVSDTVSSGDDITRTNFGVSVELTELLPSTMYYYIVESSNTVGTTLSFLLSFNTTDLPPVTTTEHLYTMEELPTIISTEEFIITTERASSSIASIGVGSGGLVILIILVIAITLPTALRCKTRTNVNVTKDNRSNSIASDTPKTLIDALRRASVVSMSNIIPFSSQPETVSTHENVWPTNSSSTGEPSDEACHGPAAAIREEGSSTLDESSNEAQTDLSTSQSHGLTSEES